LTACDASYLWLARHLDADLLTLDTELAAAAGGFPSRQPQVTPTSAGGRVNPSAAHVPGR
jgi:hypothetical protein